MESIMGLTRSTKGMLSIGGSRHGDEFFDGCRGRQETSVGRRKLRPCRGELYEGLRAFAG